MQSRKVLGPYEIVRLRRAGYTVGVSSMPPGTDTVTGGTDGLLAKLIVGGKGKLRRMKIVGIRA